MSADLIITNALVRTLDDDDRVAQAVAVQAGRIVAVGTDGEVLALQGASTQVVDAQRRTLVPGLIDAHAHMEREGLKTLRPSLAHARSVDEVLKVVAEQAQRTPPGEWIVTMPVGQPPYFFGGPSNLAEGRLPTRWELDGAAPDHPVFIPGLFGNWGVPPGHSVLNTLALKANRIGPLTCPGCKGLRIEHGADGEPTGLIVETNKRPAIEFDLLPEVPRFGFAERLEGLRRSLPIYHAHGTTTVYEGHGSAPETIAVYRALHEQGGLTMRARLCVSPTWDDLAEARRAMRDWLGYARGRGLGDEWLRISGVYIGLGGDAVIAQAARRSLPDTGWAGFVEWSNSLQDFRDQALAAAEFDLRLHAVVGDRLDEALTALEWVDRQVPLQGRRWVLEHIGRVRPQDLPRLRRLGVLVTSIPVYQLWKNGAEHLDEPDDGHGYLPQRTLMEAGFPLAAGSDNIPVSLWAAAAASIDRRERTTGRVIGPREALTRAQALKLIASHGAWLSFEEHDLGRITPGARADLALLDADPLADDSELHRIRALATWVGGRPVHRPLENET